MYYSKSAGYVVTLSLKESDTEILEKIKNILCPTRALYLQNRKEKGNMITLVVSDKNLYYQLLEHNLTPRKTFTLKPPINLPENLISHYVRGYFDGDGTIYSHKKHKLQCGVVGTLDIVSFVHSEFSKIQRNTTRVCPEGNVYCVKYSALNAVRFLQWIYKDATIYLERKYTIAVEFLGERAEQIFRREWAEEDFSILKNHYPNASREEVMELLPDFSWSAITLKASRTGIRREISLKPRIRWTEEEINSLKDIYDKYKDVAKLQYFFPARSYSTLRRMCKKLELY
jgi:hypothetical protein